MTNKELIIKLSKIKNELCDVISSDGYSKFENLYYDKYLSDALSNLENYICLSIRENDNINTEK